MKNILALLLLFTIGISAQTYQTRADLNVKLTNQGAFWGDSLHCAIYVTTDTLYTDDGDSVVSEIDTLNIKSTSEFKTAFLYDWMTITAEDTGTTYDDSLKLEYAVYTIEDDAVVDTVWQKVQFMRDSSWTNVNGSFLVDDNSVKSYEVFIGSYDLIRVALINVDNPANCVTRFWAVLSKKR